MFLSTSRRGLFDKQAERVHAEAFKQPGGHGAAGRQRFVEIALAEAAVIGKPHEVKGESIKAFVILKQGVEPTEDLKKELVMTVRKLIGPIATPDEIDFVEKLPKTRSGKIMRRVLKAQELGQPVGDVSTLED